MQCKHAAQGKKKNPMQNENNVVNDNTTTRVLDWFTIFFKKNRRFY